MKFRSSLPLGVFTAAALLTSGPVLGSPGEWFVRRVVLPTIKKLELPKEETAWAATGTLVIFKHPKGGEKGVAARVEKASRFKEHLFIWDEFGRVHLADYLTPRGASFALRQIRDGESFSLTDCVEPEELVYEHLDQTSGCSTRRYRAKLECSGADLVTFYSDPSELNPDDYEHQDIVATPLEVETKRCPRD